MTSKRARPPRQQDRKYWDDMAASWDDEIFNSLHNDKRQVIAGEIARSRRGSHSIADFGCGTGIYLPLLSRSFDMVHGFERSAACVKTARGHLKSRPNVAIHSASTASVNRYGKFDVVLCVNVAVHPAAHARDSVFRALRSLLAPTGRLILVVPSHESATMVCEAEDAALQRKGTRRRGDWDAASHADGVVTIEGMPYKHYGQKELRETLADRGLTVSRIRRAEYSWLSQGVRPGVAWRGKLPWDWVAIASPSLGLEPS